MIQSNVVLYVLARNLASLTQSVQGKYDHVSYAQYNRYETES